MVTCQFRVLPQEDIGKLLRFESSAVAPGELVSLPQYCDRLAKDQKDIYYLSAPRYSETQTTTRVTCIDR